MAADTEIATLQSFSAVYFKHVIDFIKCESAAVS